MYSSYLLSNIYIKNSLTKNSSFLLNKRKIKVLIYTILKLLNLESYSVSLTLVDKNQIKEINSTFRHINTPTDVLSFPQNTYSTPLSLIEPQTSVYYPSLDSKLNVSRTLKPNDINILGDIIISPEIALKNIKNKNLLSEEVALLIIHSILHLVGHDHINKKETKNMFTEQFLLLKILTFGYETPLWKDILIAK